MAEMVVTPAIHQSLDPETLDALRAELGGLVMGPGESGYDAARRVWNGMIDKHPALIVRPSGVADVRRAVTFAGEHGLTLAVKSGGHNVAGLAVGEGALLLDLSAMRAVGVDPAARIARAQGGALWSDLDRETTSFGLATTGGVVSTTGVAGLTLGGGIGWLVGKHGMSIDNLLAVDLVTADGAFVTASLESHPDLFWAVRGGGGNFGVATSFAFRLHPQADVLAGFVAYPVAQACEVLAFYREFTLTAPEALRAYAAIASDPESGARIVVIFFCWTGDPTAGEPALAPLRRLGPPVAELSELMPYARWQRNADGDWPHGRRYYWKGNLLRDLPAPVLAATIDHAAATPLPGLLAVFECYRGPMNRVGVSETAFPHRDAQYQLVAAGGWDDAGDDAAAIAWVRGLHAATAPFALNGTFLNFNAIDGADRGERVRASYGVNWARLVEIKRRYDPRNVFRDNNNIAP